MDRFIAVFNSTQALAQTYLKSNMDRFIVEADFLQCSHLQI